MNKSIELRPCLPLEQKLDSRKIQVQEVHLEQDQERMFLKKEEGSKGGLQRVLNMDTPDHSLELYFQIIFLIIMDY